MLSSFKLTWACNNRCDGVPGSESSVAPHADPAPCNKNAFQARPITCGPRPCRGCFLNSGATLHATSSVHPEPLPTTPSAMHREPSHTYLPIVEQQQYRFQDLCSGRRHHAEYGQRASETEAYYRGGMRFIRATCEDKRRERRPTEHTRPTNHV